MKQKIFSMRLLGFALAVIILLSGGMYALFWLPQTTDKTTPAIVTIPSGSTLNEIVSILQKNDLLRYPSTFKLAARLSGFDKQLRSGRFRIPPGAGNLALLHLLYRGEQVLQKITIPEGVTARRLAGLLQKTLDIDSTDFLQLVRDSSLVREFGLAASSLEGYLFPETYYLPWGITAREMITIMVQQFKQALPDSANELAERRNLTLHEIVTLASIIEGEAILDHERPIIAGVYYNRLRRGMPLQADPTIQYLIPDGPRRLLNADLRIDSPYNTYLYPGLPPGPINNPGRRSIEAALYPAEVPYLYMVARGDGSHVFSATLAEHRKAHRAFNRVRREVARQKTRQEKGNNDAGK